MRWICLCADSALKKGGMFWLLRHLRWIQAVEAQGLEWIQFLTLPQTSFHSLNNWLFSLSPLPLILILPFWQVSPLSNPSVFLWAFLIKWQKEQISLVGYSKSLLPSWILELTTAVMPICIFCYPRVLPPLNCVPDNIVKRKALFCTWYSTLSPWLKFF